MVFERRFWKQKFVYFALLCDLCHAGYTMSIYIGGISEESSHDFNFFRISEFYVISRVSFVFTFIFNIISSKKMQEEISEIKFKSKYVIMTTVMTESLIHFGYFASIYAY